MASRQTPADVQATLLAHRRLSTTHFYGGEPCWEWMGAKDEDGYGRMSVNGRMYIVPRVAAFLWMGLDLSDRRTVVCHHCDNPPCFNYKHLFKGTTKTNAEDAARKNRTAAGSRNGAATLTEVQAAEIRRRLHASEVSQRALAREYGVNQSTISRLAAGKKWQRALRQQKERADVRIGT